MTEWTTASTLREQVRRRWDKGELLAGLAEASPLFPLRIAMRVPTSTDLSERFDAVRAWAAELQRGTRSGYRLAMREVQHRVVGRNSVPCEAWVDTLDDALRLIGKTHDAGVFNAMLSATRVQQPLLLAWLRRNPMRALPLADQWEQMLAFVGWMQAHPRPGIYLREVGMPGIHSKFIEAQRAVLAELLDLALPEDAIESATSGASQFARRYGFRDKPLRVRFRWLDPRMSGWVKGGDGDYTVSQITFARMEQLPRRVFITENEINFLAFPSAADSMVIFGAGYGFEALAGADWLATRALHYWGDIDTHGFAILDQLRVRHPHALSFLMDRETLLAHRPQWTVEPQPTLRDLPRLNLEERSLYDEMRWSRLSDQGVRLEQERIGFEWVVRAVAHRMAGRGGE